MKDGSNPDTTFAGDQGRVMLYSHDTFGLGHLRRSRAIATALTESGVASSAIILTGSPVAGRFTFPENVDHVRLPGVKKLSDGSYISQTGGFDIEETTALRSGLIKSAVAQYDPDLLIVDKEPTGFRGELIETLETLSSGRRTRLVLGLRDVLDEPASLVAEWDRKGATDAAQKYYDEIWVYGHRQVYDPTEALPLSPESRRRMHWTGYLRREATETGDAPEGPFVLITPGGGGDGEAMVNLVLSAYEKDETLGPNAVLVYGPFLSGEVRDEFEARVARLNGRVKAVGFDSLIEALFAAAEGVVCMGGYNTFCEVLSFDKRAVIVPRTVPRREQWIRAKQAEKMGLVRMIDEERDGLTAEAMIEAIRALPSQPKPSEACAGRLLNGLPAIIDRTRGLMASQERASSG
ncbi:MAG: glycosyltransferase [Pseudomonadota bacterium]